MSLARRPLRSAWHEHANFLMKEATKSLVHRMELELFYGEDLYAVYKDSVLLMVLEEYEKTV